MEEVSQSQMCEVEFIYNKASAKINFSSETCYEDIIKIALRRFGIPMEYEKFIQISFQNRYTFDKITFEYYLKLFPAPQIAFEIDVDYVALLDGLHDSMLSSEEEQKQPKKRNGRHRSRGSSRSSSSYFKKPRVPKATAT